MKKTVIVTITKSIDIEISDELLTEDYMKEFSSYMFPVFTQSQMFDHAARCAARGVDHYVEGLGYVSYTENYEDVETEVL